jgi:hypothetical protein
LLRWDRHITWLTREELAGGLRQLLAQPWLDPELRTTLEQGLERVDRPAIP